MAAILCDSTVVVVRTRPRAIPLATITARNSIHGFLLVFYMGKGLRLAARRSLAVTSKSVLDFQPYRKLSVGKKKVLLQNPTNRNVSGAPAAQGPPSGAP